MNQILQYFKGRLTFSQFLTILAEATIPIQAWAFYTLFEDLKVLLQDYNLSESWATWSYTFFYVIIDVLVLTVFVVIPLYLIPKQFIRGRYVEIGLLNILVIILTAILIKFNASLFDHIDIFFWALVLFVFFISAITSRIPPKILAILAGIAERLVVLAFLFWAIDILGLITIFLRNFI